MNRIFHYSKYFAAIAFLLLLTAANAQRVQVKEGTQLVYQVDEWGKKYTYTVTIVSLSDSVHHLQWKASGSTVYKGESINNYIDMENADRVLIKPNLESLERLDEYTSRLVLPQSMSNEIEQATDTLAYGIGIAADALLAWRSKGEKVKELLYNDRKIKFEYRYYKDVDLGITIGFMPYGANKWWIYDYKDENCFMQLVEVKTFIPKLQPPPLKLDTLSVGSQADTIGQ